MPRYAPDVLDILLELIREALPDVAVRSAIPDGVPGLVPLVVLRRIGGSSVRPKFWDGCLMNVQCWAAGDGDDIDPARAAGDLADSVRRTLWEALESQTVTTYGHIIGLRETQGPMEIGDVDLPHLARFSATYNVRVRPALA